MKVEEKGTDRRLDVHLYVKGQMDALTEYDEYVDAGDGAICCYVAVAEDMTPKVTTRFHGTTMSIFHDVLIDGVLRKSHRYKGKSVSHQASKKYETQIFLYQTASGDRDTEIKVAPLEALVPIQGEGKETVGTIEVRVSVLRAFGEEYSIDGIPTYFKQAKEEEDAEPAALTFKRLAPEFEMIGEENCQTLDKAASNRHRRDMTSKRPGKQPWAIFRFHYRSQAAIDQQEMEANYHPKSKDRNAAHVLQLEPVPQLKSGLKPPKMGDDDASTQASSIPPTPLVMKAPPKFPTSPRAQEDEDESTPERSPSPELRRASKDEDADEEPTHAPATKADNVTASEAAVEPEKSEEQPTPAQESEQNSKLDTADKASTQSTTSDSPSEPSNINENTVPSPAKEATPKPSQPTPAAAKKRPAPLVLPTKRPAQQKMPLSPIVKRTKRPATAPPSSTPSNPSNVPATSQTQILAELRKKLRLAKAHREKIATKRAEVKEQLAVYDAQMAEEIERASKELEDEQRGQSEELLHLREEANLLKAFKAAESSE
ncbi:hypothetical protein CC80DRAFT_241402 [Byssothecium circinans]|uniref:Uncharacterized protein n=1 Tax=Byssothecium circinans TaxID=147558 RepID=A0A6A5TFK3_9PLEO|nr:hypothetical protein CC80DRAFT_241402 [Byssothecium circinans]